MKPKHPMEVLRSWKTGESTGLIPETNDTEMLIELIQSVKHYFSYENIPNNEEIENIAREYYGCGWGIDERHRHFIDGYKAAIERMKR